MLQTGTNFVQTTTITATGVAQTITLPTETLAFGNEWKVVVKVGNEEETLVVQKLNPDTTVVVGSGFVAGQTTTLPYGTVISGLTFPANENDAIQNPNIAIVPTGANAEFTATLSGNVLTVVVTAENGDTVSYSYILAVATIDASDSGATAVAATGTNTITVNVEDTIGTDIENLTASNFAIYDTGTTNKLVPAFTSFTNNNDGTYTIVVTKTAATYPVDVVVDGVKVETNLSVVIN